MRAVVNEINNTYGRWTVVGSAPKRDFPLEEFLVWFNRISARQLTRFDVGAWQQRTFAAPPSTEVS